MYFIEAKMFVYSLKGFKKFFENYRHAERTRVPHVPNRYRMVSLEGFLVHMLHIARLSL
jgi:hypothetical protein